MAKKSEKNLLDFYPRRSVEWEKVTDKKIDLILPKFQSKILQKFIKRIGKTPVIRIHLDTYGSHVWKYCDGSHSIFEIGKILENQYGKEIEPVYERLSMFIQSLRRHRYIVLAPEETKTLSQ